ncbi:unnamed protein product [Cunninghamella blakesleeana]
MIMDWNELFGSDDDEYDDTILNNYSGNNSSTIIQDTDIIKFEDIPGLILWRSALDHDQQMKLSFSLVETFGTETNQYLQFGTLDPNLQVVSDMLQQQQHLFPTPIMQRQPLFNQASINYYEQGEGILSHVDLLQYEDGIAILSLLSSVCMTMKPATKESISSGYKVVNNDKGKGNQDEYQKDILLRPGDILLLYGPARYDWEHGIKERIFDVINGETVVRGKRASVSLRYKKVEGS